MSAKKIRMKLTLATLLCLALVASINSLPKDRPVDRNKLPSRVVCYWGTWAFYRDGADGKFEPEMINPHLCTHINYGFAKLEGNKIALFDKDLDTGDEEWTSGLSWGHGFMYRLTELRKYNPNLAIMISIGGWNEGSNKYSKMVSSAAGRHEFVQSVMEFLKEHDFDGLDLDWEYPAMASDGEADRTPGRDQDKQDFTELIKELHEAFKPVGYILTAAVSAGKPTIDRAYDVPKLNQYLDFINLMSYDYHGGWDDKTAHNSPLYPLPGTTGTEHDFTVSYAVEYWLKLGADAKKLVLGVPLYGRTFTLATDANTGIGAPVTGKGGDAGQITRTIGMLGYNEICSMIKQGWQTSWNDVQQIPYAYHAHQWIGYDNVRSIEKKMEYLKKMHLGGAMIWTVDTDDFTGHCGEQGGKYPLLKTISRSLNNIDGPDMNIPRVHATTPHSGEVTLTTSAPAQTNAPSQPQTQAPSQHQTAAPNHPGPSGDKFTCSTTGFFKDPSNPSKFHQCVDMAGQLKDYVFTCPNGLHYSEQAHVCAF